MKAELIVLVEKSQTQKCGVHFFSCMKNLGLKRSERRKEIIWKEEAISLGVRRREGKQQGGYDHSTLCMCMKVPQ